MKLSALLNDVLITDLDTEVNGLAIDSRGVQTGNAFIALQGARQHGLQHAPEAIAKGAKVVIYDPAGLQMTDVLDLTVPKLAIPNLDKHLGNIAAGFYGNPSRSLTVIGVTGTNGKTTCSQLLAQAIPDCGVIGTLGWGRPGSLSDTLNTTPDAVSIQQMLAEFVKQKLHAVAMEVSSHGLELGRVNAVDFTGAVFTNLSRDHLDYHGNMDAYYQAKLRLFKQEALKFAVLNADDPATLGTRHLLSNSVQCWTFSAKGKFMAGTECLIAENVRHNSAGTYFQLNWDGQKIEAYTSLVGAFNLENVLAVLAVLLAIGTPLLDAIAVLPKLQAITGRMEKFGGHDKPTVYVDYAHSPDALEKALKAAKGQGLLWVVFGCGGNRDKGKRRDMGRIAESLADQVILTDDNPRYEAAADIIEDILEGCNSGRVTVINDRKLAITTAIQQAGKHDCVLIAGKGHENYQEINGIKFPFSDQEVAQQSLTKLEQLI